MNPIISSAKFIYNGKENQFECLGSWLVADLHALALPKLSEIPKKKGSLAISGKQVQQFDSAGALALQSLMRQLHKKGYPVELVHFSTEQLSLLGLVEDKIETITYQARIPRSKNVLYYLGKETIHKIGQIHGFINLLGDFCVKIAVAFGQLRRFRLPAIISNIYSAGLQALPILALLSFLVGVVLAYQMGLQLKTYGANSYIAYLSGMAIFREFGPLITAIIVAGRTGSAFTAQLGSMKINEEIDALLTMGLSPTELLVMPKVIGLTLVFPLLIFWSDVFNILGSMIMSREQLGIEYVDFLQKLKDSVGLKQMMLGLYKAPTFSILIALVGCFQGFAVASNADSIGSQTTKSVVQALFLIIIADAIYSVIYSWMDL